MPTVVYRASVGDNKAEVAGEEGIAVRKQQKYTPLSDFSAAVRVDKELAKFGESVTGGDRQFVIRETETGWDYGSTEIVAKSG